MARPDLTAQRLRELLDYDQNTGVFLWKARNTRHVKAGSLAGHITERGYRRIWIDCRNYRAHRLAWLYVYSSWPSDEIDHINGIKTDNRISNLRDVSRSTNTQNRRAADIDSSSGVLGVTRNWNRWKASICVNKIIKHLGTFDSIEEAGAAYLAAKRKYHGGCTI